MLKKDWKKNLLRVKQIADQNLGRAEKTEVLSEDLVVLEKRVDLIKQVFQNTTKKLGACIQGQGTDVEKRLRKIPESGLSHSMIESATLLGDNTLMGVMYQLCGEAEGSIAREWLQYEMEVENRVLTPLQGLLESEIPAIAKLRKNLSKITIDMDAARGRYQNAARQTQTSASMSVNKVDTLKDELEDASTRVEQSRDNLCTEMYSFLSKEADYSKLLLELIEEQAMYHRHSLDILDKLIPQMKSKMEQCVQMPVFGCSLEDHLRRTNRDIASVLEDCVCTLLEIGMDEEGLFRIAGGASKVKKLKTAFDAGAADMSEYVRDVPCIAGCLKLYLRELPEPLMTYALYNEWMQAAHLPADQRLQALWVVMDKLPRPNYNNLRYLIKFLAKLAENQELNKMSSSNIAIVMGPNLIWPPGESGPSVLTTSTQSAIVESFITHADWFFPGDIDFHKTGRDAVSLSADSGNDLDALPPGGKVKRQKASVNKAFGMMHHTLLAPITPPTAGGATELANNSEKTSPKAKSRKKKNSRSEKVDVSSDEDTLSSQGSMRRFLKKRTASSRSSRGIQEEKEAEAEEEEVFINPKTTPLPPPPSATMLQSVTQSDTGKPTSTEFSISNQISHEEPTDNHNTSTADVTVNNMPDIISDTTRADVNNADEELPFTGPPARPPPPKSFHSDVYNTAFALHSLHSDGWSDYLTRVRTLMDGHMNKRLSSSGSYQISSSSTPNGAGTACRDSGVSGTFSSTTSSSVGSTTPSSGNGKSVENEGALQHENPTEEIDFNLTGNISTPHSGTATPPAVTVNVDMAPASSPSTSPAVALCAATLPAPANNNHHTMSTGSDSVSLLGSSPKLNRKLNKKPAPLPPQLPPPPVPPYQSQSDRLSAAATTPTLHSPTSESATSQVTISSPVLISTSCLADTRPTIPDRPQTHTSGTPPAPGQQPNSPRPDRPRGPPPERPMGPPPDRPSSGTIGVASDKPDRPHLPPTRLEPGIDRNDRKGSGRPARPTPPPPPPPEKRESYGRDEMDGERPPTPPTRRESQQDSVVVEETHL